MKVTTTVDAVIWSDFQIHHHGVSIDAVFRFNPRQYRAVLDRLCLGGHSAYNRTIGHHSLLQTRGIGQLL